MVEEKRVYTLLFSFCVGTLSCHSYITVPYSMISSLIRYFFNKEKNVHSSSHANTGLSCVTLNNSQISELTKKCVQRNARNYSTIIRSEPCNKANLFHLCESDHLSTHYSLLKKQTDKLFLKPE